MTASTASQALVDAAAMVSQHDVAGTLSRLLADCAKFTAADAIGILVKDEVRAVSASPMRTDPIRTSA